MRPGQQNKRSRGRNSGRKHTNPLARNFESNGPDVKIRGNAAHIAEKYVQLARDAQASGDNVMSENYLQHAEHYFRILSAAQAQNAPQPRTDQQPGGVDRDENEEAETSERAPQRAEKAEESAAEPSPAVAEQAEASSESAEANPAGEGDERPKRTRRPRRKPRSEGEGDLAGSPQPELPAFLTGNSQSAAE